MSLHLLAVAGVHAFPSLADQPPGLDFDFLLADLSQQAGPIPEMLGAASSSSSGLPSNKHRCLQAGPQYETNLHSPKRVTTGPLEVESKGWLKVESKELEA